MIDHIYYEGNYFGDSLIVLQRSSDGHGNLVTRSVDSGDTEKMAFTSMDPPCHRDISTISTHLSLLIICTSMQSILKYTIEEKQIKTQDGWPGKPVQSMSFSPNNSDWVWIGGLDHGLMGTTFDFSENKNLKAWSIQHSIGTNYIETNYCTLSNRQNMAANQQTSAFVKGQDTFMFVSNINNYTGSINALLCNMSSQPSSAKPWITPEINNSLMNFTAGSKLKAASIVTSTNIEHPIFLAVQSPDRSHTVLVWYEIERQGKQVEGLSSLFPEIS